MASTWERIRAKTVSLQPDNYAKLGTPPMKQPTPYYGFNFLWIYTTEWNTRPLEPDLKALDFLQETGFNFVRIPTDYKFWISNFEYTNPDESRLKAIDGYLAACSERNLHMSLNIHRGPGYCINNNEQERDNLWLDQKAQDGFVFQWEMFAKRYKGTPSSKLSFDLLNEPPSIGQYGMTRENHAAIMRRTVAAIRAIDPDREVVIDGLDCGNLAMPELSDLNVVHSGRGYQPAPISHYGATWVPHFDTLPKPKYPGLDWGNKIWNKETLRDCYRPWLELQETGTPIHIGECGCFNQTPNDVALRWFTDLFALYKEFGWGFALWQFEGHFGIIKHGRPGARYETLHGYQVDMDLLDLIVASRA
jgi:hypothetical protein